MNNKWQIVEQVILKQLINNKFTEKLIKMRYLFVHSVFVTSNIQFDSSSGEKNKFVGKKISFFSSNKEFYCNNCFKWTNKKKWKMKNKEKKKSLNEIKKNQFILCCWLLKASWGLIEAEVINEDCKTWKLFELSWNSECFHTLVIILHEFCIFHLMEFSLSIPVKRRWHNLRFVEIKSSAGFALMPAKTTYMMHSPSSNTLELQKG